MSVNQDLVNHIEANIFPRYEKFYSHGMMHINNVIANMLELAAYYRLDESMSYTIAAYHDVGLSVDRNNHEIESGKILCSDRKLREFFTQGQIKIMQEAVEDHRGSRKECPRSFYGECVSDSDRDFDIALLAKRQLATSLKNNPGIDLFEEHFERCYQYICKRINDKGLFNLWTNYPVFIAKRNEFQKNFLNKSYALGIYEAEWNRISADGTKELIIGFYEDY